MRVQVSALLIAGFWSVGAYAAPPTTPSAPPKPAEITAAGLWEQVDDNTGEVQSWFRVVERNGIYEGTIVKMFLKPGDDPNPICTRCEGEQKNAPVLGLTIIKGLQRKGLNYENGTVLDPMSGSVYNAMIQVQPDGKKLTFRGYLGIALLGRSQIWNRLPDNALDQTSASGGNAAAGKVNAVGSNAARAQAPGTPAPKRPDSPQQPKPSISVSR
jgi:uncharacterized protein (DUF2147 family)